MADTRTLDPKRLLRTLAAHDVRYLVIGVLGARLHDFPLVAADAAIIPARTDENLRRLAAALRELEARVITEAVPDGLPFDCSPARLRRADHLHLVTTAGRIAVTFTPSDRGGYDDLAPNAVPFEVYGVDLAVVRLEDVL